MKSVLKWPLVGFAIVFAGTMAGTELFPLSIADVCRTAMLPGLILYTYSTRFIPLPDGAGWVLIPFGNWLIWSLLVILVVKAIAFTGRLFGKTRRSVG